jgi:hypothetical protein
MCPHAQFSFLLRELSCLLLLKSQCDLVIPSGYDVTQYSEEDRYLPLTLSARLHTYPPLGSTNDAAPPTPPKDKITNVRHAKNWSLEHVTLDSDSLSNKPELVTPPPVYARICESQDRLPKMTTEANQAESTARKDVESDDTDFEDLVIV